MEDIKKMSDDINKNVGHSEKELEIGTRYSINGKLHKWDGENWIPVEVASNSEFKN